MIKLGARCLLVGAFAMVANLSCGQPKPPAAPEERIDPARKNVLVMVHTTDGRLIATSRYEVADSVIVINEILRNPKLYPKPDQAHLYQKEKPGMIPGDDVQPPLTIPLDQVARIEMLRGKYTPSNSGPFAGGLILGIFGTMVLLLIGLANSGFSAD